MRAGARAHSLTLASDRVRARRSPRSGELFDAMKKIFLSLPPCGSLVSRFAGSPCRELGGKQLARRSRMGCHQSLDALRSVQAVWPSAWRRSGRVRYGTTRTSWPPSAPAAPDRSGLRPGSARGMEGLLLEDDPAVRVQSGGALVSRALWAATLVASDGPMNVPNERRSVESDEETFMDRHGRSLHLLGRTCRMTRSDRPFAV